MTTIRKNKGFIIEFLDGTKKLVTKTQMVSSENRITEGKMISENEVIANKVEVVPFNSDYMVYSSPKTKYGLIPSQNIKDLYEVKWIKNGGVYQIFDFKNQQLMVLD